MNETSNLPISAAVAVYPVTNRQELRKFIDVPWLVYANDPMWVPPLRLERRWHFSKSNPFFVPSLSILVNKISPAPLSHSSLLHLNASIPVELRPP